MIQHILHVASKEGGETPQEWEIALAKQGFQLLRAADITRAGFYLKSYPLVALLLDLDSDVPAFAERIQKLKSLPAKNDFALIGLASGQASEADSRMYAEAGLGFVFDPQAAPEFLVYILKLKQMVEETRAAAASGITVQSLAAETRKKLHDLSQPLAALQGKLQVLGLKAAEDDPLRKPLNDMAQLAMQVTDHLRQLHDLHRNLK
ncbi:hypothetical protein HY256_05125 [Candidatus Sumerlaeota bacterium]|nr:hypothetical protein [Candidatus Sumerlaeota bacterium]